MEAIVTVESPLRGTQTQLPITFRPSRLDLTWSWGLQPATAMLDLVYEGTAPTVVPMALMTITAGGHTFYGFPNTVVPVSSAQGRWIALEFVDMREFLQWDVVYGLFNRRENRLVNGVFVRRYYHIYPRDFNTSRRTYTNGPLTGAQILDLLFNADTVQSPWARTYHPNLNQVLYDLDCMNGRKLGEVVNEVSQRLGTTFTLFGQYGLVWCVKGVGTVPVPPANATKIRTGVKMSGNPSRLRVLGGRNCYQVLNLTLEPDWLAAFEPFFDVDIFADDLFNHEATEAAIADIAAGTPYNAIPGDGDGLVGRQLAKARALTITVGQYAFLRDVRDGSGNSFRDGRKFSGRSRLSMPVALYIRVLLFRAYRPPNSWQLVNADENVVDLYSMEMIERGLVEVSHDPVSGDMTWKPDVVTATNGYAVAQGYQVGQDGFRTLNPARFDMDAWLGAQYLWQRIEFHTDDSGEGTKFIIFDEPMIRSADLIQEVTIGGVVQDYPVLKANPTFNAVPVRAALTFAAERFSVIAGAGTKDDVAAVDGLNGEFVAFANGDTPVELPFANGLAGRAQGAQIAGALLNGQLYYDYGGWEVAGSNGQLLSPVIDRVTVSLSAAGLTETVDLTGERSRQVDGLGRVQIEAARDFDRRESLQPLLPGQRELKVEANQTRLLGAALRANRRSAKTIREAFHDIFGYDTPPTGVTLGTVTGGPAVPTVVNSGVPLWRESDAATLNAPGASVTGGLPLAPGSTVVRPVFAGATVHEGSPGAGTVAVTLTGINGVVLARVIGPVVIGDRVGFDQVGGKAGLYLVRHGQPVVGRVQEAIAVVGDGTVPQTVKLIRVDTNVDTGINWRGVYDPTQCYAIDDVVNVPTPVAPATATQVGTDTDGTGQTVKVFSIPGHYIAVKPVPVVPVPATTDSAGNTIIYQPRYPLAVKSGGTTATPVTDADTARVYWHLWSLGIQTVPDCDGSGNEVQAWADAQPVPAQT